MSGGERIRGSASGWAALLAMLALCLQVLVPQGYMVAQQGGRPAIVICTGHGPLLSGADLGGHPSKAPKPKSDMACGFAAHGVAAPPPSMFAAVETPAPDVSEIAVLEADLAPGRGLAAPPPPSQGPPALIL